VRSIKANVSSLNPGDHLGDYQLLLEVGVGGMGRVWAARRARGLPSTQLVALKTGLGEVGGSPEFERLFLDEARIASQIEHPNACAVHELGRDKGLLYLVMEWCDGATLRDIVDGLPDHRLEYEVAARVIADVCAGLHAAHELTDEDGAPLNVVHRDVSPQNVLVWTAGHVKVADFGVAKARGQLHRPTETGEVKGKLSYMAPEQVTSSNIDRRADIFGIGCLLYESTVGKRPYQGGDALATLYQLLERETVKPSEIDPDYPPALERIVMKALEREPDDRYATAAEMGRALASWLASRRAIVSGQQIATVVADSVGERVATRKRLITDTIERLDSDQPLTTSVPPAPDTETNEPTVKPVIPDESRSLTLPEAARSRRSDRGIITWLAAGAAALVLVVIVLALGLDRSPEPESTAPASSEPAPPIESSSPPVDDPQQVLVMITAQPPAAQVRLDDESQGANPLVRRVPADGSKHVAVVTAPGYEPQTRRLTFDEEQEVVIRLDPLPESTAKPLPTAPPPVVTSRPVGPRPTATGSKPPRPIDTDNPFGEGG
jgi:serine/threonine protein kinase